MQFKHRLMIAAVLAGSAVTGFAAAERGISDVPLKPAPKQRPVLQDDAMDRMVFLQAHPGVRFSEQFGRITRVYGKSFGGGATAADAAAGFVQEAAAGLWGLDPNQLLPIGPWQDQSHVLPLMTDPVTLNPKFLLFGYVPHIDGVPVYDSALRVMVKNEPGYPVVLASSQIPSLGAFEAVGAKNRIALNQDSMTEVAGDRFNTADISGVRPVVFAGVNGESQEPRMAAEFILDGSDMLGERMKYRFITDPVTGEIFHEENLILHADVTVRVQANRTERYSMECGPESAAPLPHARVTVGGNVYVADIDGYVTIPNSGNGSVTVNAEARTQFFNVDNGAGDVSGTFQSGSTNGTLTINQNNSNDAQRAYANTSYFAEETRNFALTYNAFYPTISTQQNFTINTGVGGSCNAFYDGGSINFYNAGGSCSNTATDVIVIHEYGHHLVNVGGSGQGEYGEGTGDTVGVLMTGDPRLAVGFYTNQCSSGIRNADNTCSFSSGCSTCGSAIHTCGQLLSGLVYEIRNALISAGKPTTSIEDAFINSIPLHNGTSINGDIVVDLLSLNDDDADTNNGTPDYVQFAAGANAKNLPVPDLELFGFSYPSGLPSFVDPSNGVEFPVRIEAFSASPDSGSENLRYRVDNGPWINASLEGGAGGNYTARIPAVECEAEVSFYVTASASGAVITDPSNAPASSYAAIGATDLILAYENDFESNSVGWIVSNDPGLSAGAWERGNPAGTDTRGEPEAARDGLICFVTENGNGNFDIDGGCTTLTSPTLDASEPGITIKYSRWWDNTGDGTGNAPNEDLFTIQVSDNDGASWVDLEVVGPVTQSSGGWFDQSFRVSDYVNGTDQFKIRFTACDTGEGSVCEAAIDGFRLESFECETAPECPGDYNNDSVVDGSDLGALLAAFGSVSPAFDLDGVPGITGSDLGFFLSSFGPCP